ncbi:MAG: FtsW/RodA/SpoVE family cell cycle protein [Paludibacter sp.]|jgi:cell division protein FtsW|nr:FtsW/RodA/SpoVE family cell cycle protein [Paludibacter sp.]
MDSLLKKYLRGDATLWIVFIMLCIVSIIEMYSASSTLAYKAANHTAPMLRHVGFLAGGALIAVLVHLIPFRYIRLISYLVLVLSVFMLILVLFKGKSENDASRWLVIGGFNFQPSELAKLSVIIVAADFISRIKNPKTDEKKYFWSTVIMLGIICPLILLENFSTAVILFGVVFIMMFIGRVSIKRLGILAGAILMTIILGFGAIKAIPQEKMPKAFDRAYTWTARIDRFTENTDDEESKYEITDENRQVQHGRIAIARGGIFGVFPGNSIERDYLPQAYSDFIYAIIVEEMGLVGGIFVILLYLILLFRAGRIATESPTVFPAVLVIGLSLMIVIQSFVSMSVATSLGPVTGQPLPLISRGGTSILITCIYFGIIFGITRQLKEGGQPVDETMDEKEEDKIPVVTLDEL